MEDKNVNQDGNLDSLRNKGKKKTKWLLSIMVWLIPMKNSDDENNE